MQIQENNLTDNIWIELYRPDSFENLIFNDKAKLIKFLENPSNIPSFIFYSNSPGTGKSTTAKLIIKTLHCDSLCLNSSEERGIDVVRDKINIFARSLSSNPNIKRCVFMDEFDGTTRQLQDSLRNLIEEYSDNCFFILTANDISKIIEPIRSRCQEFNFDNPNKAAIINRLETIAEKELIDGDFGKLVDYYYPDIRRMIHVLQEIKITGAPWKYKKEIFEDFYQILKNKEINKIYEIVYSGSFDLMGFNNWFFEKIFEEYQKNKMFKVAEISLQLADIEKHYNLGCNKEVIFISNILQILKYL